jgi:hypothetical protein
LDEFFANSRHRLLRAADLLEGKVDGIAIVPADVLTEVQGDIDQLRRQLHISTRAARWTFTEGDSAVIVDDRGAEHRIPVDSPLLVDSSLGDPVVVIDEQTESGVILRYVLPGPEPALPAGSPELSVQATEYLSPLLIANDDSANAEFYGSLLASNR